MKNHETRPTTSIPFPEANATRTSHFGPRRGRGHGCGRGHGRGCNHDRNIS